MRSVRSLLWLPAVVLAAALVTVPVRGARGAGDEIVFAEALAGGWSDWSWGTQVSFAGAAPVHTGAAAIEATYTQAWAGLYLHVEPALAGAQYQALRFWIRGTGVGSHLRVALATAGGQFGPAFDVTAVGGVWNEVAVSVATLGGPESITGIVWQDTSRRRAADVPTSTTSPSSRDRYRRRRHPSHTGRRPCARDRRRRRRAPDQPRHLRHELRRCRARRGAAPAGAALGRQRDQPLQLADRHQQHRQRLVLREHRPGNPPGARRRRRPLRRPGPRHRQPARS